MRQCGHWRMRGFSKLHRNPRHRNPPKMLSLELRQIDLARSPNEKTLMTHSSENNHPDLTKALAAALCMLPEPVQNGFWKATSRLVGGAISIPAAMLRRPTQAIEDKTDAKSLVTRRIAEAVAERAAADPEIIERAMESLVREEYRKQSNKEKVAQAAAETLNSETSSDVPTADNAEIDEDWMNVFVRYAEDASSERMQTLWGRVLAGEIRKPGNFALSTIRFLSELDSHIAKHFEQAASWLVEDTIYYSEEKKSGVNFGRLLELENAGLLNVSGGLLAKNLTINEQGIAHFSGKTFCLQIEGKSGCKLSIPAIILTRLGREIAVLVSRGGEIPELKKIAEHLKTEKQISRILLGALVYEGGVARRVQHLEVLWNPQPTA